MKKRVTMKDIANYLNIDRTTVSKALANPPRVSVKMVQRVKEAVEELGYIKDPFASGLMTGKNALLGIVLADMHRGIYGPLVANFQRTAKAFQYGVIIQYVDRDQDNLTHTIDLLRQQRVSGVTFVSTSTRAEHDEILIQLAKLGVAVNTTGRDFISDRIDRIRFNNIQAGYEATSYLIEKGHKNIVFMSKPAVSSTSYERKQGYIQAMQNAHLQPNCLVIHGGKMESGEEVQAAYHLANESWEAFSTKPTAWIGVNDNYALGILHALKDKGVQIPLEAAIMGFDDLHAQLAVPAISSMRMPVSETGKAAAQMLLKRIKNPEASSHFKMLHYEKVERDST